MRNSSIEPPARAVSLGDIARSVGVSSATVSRVINGSVYVSPETREAVEAAVAAHGYVVNGAARALASKRTRTIGALVPSFTSALSYQTIDSFQRAIEDAGYVLLLAGSDYDPVRARKNTEAMVGRGVDGVFIITVTDDQRIYELLRQHKTPFLTTMPNTTGGLVPYVGYDHRAAGTRVAEFLLDLGHRQIGLVRTRLSQSIRLEQRVSAIEAAITKRRDEGATATVIEEPTSTLASGRDALRRLQARGELPTGVIATNDVLAAGMVMECNRQGIRIPEDISIIGYGDMEIAEHVTPAITTVRTPKDEIGERAARSLLAASQGETMTSQDLAFELVIRETTSAPPPLNRHRFSVTAS